MIERAAVNPVVPKTIASFKDKLTGIGTIQSPGTLA